MNESKEGQSQTDEVEVLRAAAQLVAAFGEHRVADYFGCFDESATFIFHNVSQPLRSRADYERLWLDWERHLDFRVLECRSSNEALDVHGDVAVFTHDVRTRTSTLEGEETLVERETIIFRRVPDSGWLAVHEHLSTMPDGE
ncbi:YybH family protein [Ornithinimicrobium sediminis]|uniref:YybH family protein n=1 Tax=Ornithinimicrobium sediminis TaxID=2904603 RepID=UPI001E48E908|nr:nuclear transport factor 2 family protein [Ornithinimicrobium sediminis]MCE0488275.1 nuclear transport factor 2 family protein [Ornithinimicrobium sediminis]